MKQGNPQQIDAIWKALGELIEERLNSGKTLFISTHGLGVSWLHLRLETSEKYFTSYEMTRARAIATTITTTETTLSTTQSQSATSNHSNVPDQSNEAVTINGFAAFALMIVSTILVPC